MLIKKKVFNYYDSLIINGKYSFVKNLHIEGSILGNHFRIDFVFSGTLLLVINWRQHITSSNNIEMDVSYIIRDVWMKYIVHNKFCAIIINYQ